MYEGMALFAQLMDFLPWTSFHRIVQRYGGNPPRQDAFLCGAVSRDGVRAIDLSREPARYRSLSVGAGGKDVPHGVSRTDQALDTGRCQREPRLAHLYADFAQGLIRQARKLYTADALGVELADTVYALDSTTIDLCLSMFPWAPFRSTKAAIKMHTLLDLRGAIPSFIHISDGKLHDVNDHDRGARDANG